MSVRVQLRRPARKPEGAFATFYHLRGAGMSSSEAHAVVRKWSHEARSCYAPNPLDMATRKQLTAHYARHTGDFI